MIGMEQRPRLTEDTYVELVCSLFSTLLPTIIMVASFLLVGGWIVVETHDPALIDLLLMAAIAALGRMTILLLHRDEVIARRVTAARARRLERRFAIPYLGFALFFGLFAARAFAIGSADARLLLIGLLFGYGAGVATGISLRPWISIPSVAIAIIPAIVTSIFLPTPGNWRIALLTAVFLLGGIDSMRRRYHASARQFTLQRLLAKIDRRDELTGLPNQVMLRESFSQITGSASAGEMIAIHCITVDQVDAINGNHGYTAGDAVLKAVTERLGRLTGPRDIVVRLGGYGFAIVQTEPQQPADAEALAHDIVTSIAMPYSMGGQDLRISAHVGYALGLKRDADLDRLLNNADDAARRARREARDVIGHSHVRWTVKAAERRGKAARRN